MREIIDKIEAEHRTKLDGAGRQQASKIIMKEQGKAQAAMLIKEQ